MKTKTQALSGALLSATLLMGFAPAHAASTPTSSIGTYAKKHVSTLGKALAPEETYANGASSQRFQNGLLTWSKRTGVQVLTNPTEIDAFLKAGGAATFGALESGSWRNSFCGQSVTTFDGKTRWLVVVDSKTQPLTSIDLNSAEGKTWKSERSKTGKCFTPTQVAEDPSQPANPQIDLDWSKATYVKNQSALLLQTDTTAYVTKADGNGTRIADAAVYEVEWLKTNAQSRDFWNGTSTQNSSFSVLGTPTGDATWNGDTSTQTFTNGTVTWKRGDTRLTVQLTQTGFKALEQQAAWGSIDAYPGIYTGKLTPVEDRFFTESTGQNVFVYDAETENSAWMDARVYDEFIKDTSRFGTITSSYGIGDGRGGVEYNFVTTVFTAEDGSTNELAGFLSQSVYVYPSQGEHYLINNEPVPAQTDPATIDWSQQGGLIGNQQALYYQDGDSALIIAANPDGTPKEGAKAFRSDWLGFQMSHSGRFNWNDGTGWAYGSPYTEDITLAGALGVPVADGYYVEENGQTYYLQDFEGGHIKWTVPSNKLIEFDDSPVEITLNALGQARSDANDAKLTLG